MSATVEMTTEVAMRPTRTEKASFAIGDIASNLTWSTISSYLLFFYTDVALIGAAAAGTLMLLARVFDALIDPLVGLLVDRTNTRFGRARPYLIFGAPVLGILTILTFWTPGTGGAADLVWAYVTFILVGVAYAAINVPYGALMAMVTRDSASRMTLAGFRNAGATIGLLIVSVSTMPLVALLGQGDERRGFFLTAVVFGTLGMILFWVVAAAVKERVTDDRERDERAPLRPALRTLVRNRHWLAVFFAALFQFARLGVITGGAVFFAINVIRQPDSVSLILLALAVSGLAASFIAPWTMRRLGHRRGTIVSLVIFSLLTLAILPLQSEFTGFLILFFIANLVGGIGFVALPALVSDSVEYQEFVSGQRNEGLLYSGYSFATKVGSALGGAVLAWGLAAIGYSSTSTPDQVSDGIAVLFLVVPVLLAILQIVALAFYSLERDLPAITDALELRRASGR